MNKTRKSRNGLNAKKICLKTLTSKKFKSSMKNMGVSVNVNKLRKNKTFMKAFVDGCVKKLKSAFRA